VIDEDGGTAVLMQQLPAPSTRQKGTGVRTHTRESDESLAIARRARADQLTDEAALRAEGDTERRILDIASGHDAA
jgi:hypothetical protein